MEKSSGIQRPEHITRIAKLNELDLTNVVDGYDGIACREAPFFVKGDDLWCNYVEKHRLPFKVCSFDELTDISYHLYPPNLAKESRTEKEIRFDTKTFRIKHYNAGTNHPKLCSSVSICEKELTQVDPRQGGHRAHGLTP